MATTGLGVIRHTTLIITALLLLSGCATLRQFGPSVQVASVTPGQYIALKRGDILTSGRLSAATTETLRVAGLDETTCAKPGLPCIEAMEASIVVREEDKRSTLAELWLQQAMAMPAPKAKRGTTPAMIVADPGFQPRLDAWMQVARQAYAYLFFTERTANQRGFEDRQTQVRDYYNLAAQEAAVMLFDAYSSQQVRNKDGRLQLGRWTFVLAPADTGVVQDTREPIELVPAASLSFTGTLRRVQRRDGFGAELVAVMADPASDGLAAAHGHGRTAADDAASAQRWSGMPSPSITVLLRFSGANLWEVLHDETPTVEIHDPYQIAAVELHGQKVPLAANFTAGYALWLARANFSRQSLRSLFGSKGGIDRPHLFMLQPYDPNRRVLLMIHGLASSPEAWVNVANELMRDDEIRREFQVWQFYYPTNMPIALSHDAIRHTLDDVMQHYDPTGKAQASHDMVVVAQHGRGHLAPAGVVVGRPSGGYPAVDGKDEPPTARTAANPRRAIADLPARAGDLAGRVHRHPAPRHGRGRYPPGSLDRPACAPAVDRAGGCGRGG